MQEQPRVLPHDNTEAFFSLGLQDYKHNNSPTPDQLQELRIRQEIKSWAGNS